SSPFTLGNAMRIFGRNKFYLKNGQVAEKLSQTDTIVFDKTGTITLSNQATVHFEGKALAISDMRIVKTLAAQLNHPLSRKVFESIPEMEEVPVAFLKEYEGQGPFAII